jgi:hypothetical protein
MNIFSFVNSSQEILIAQLYTDLLEKYHLGISQTHPTLNGKSYHQVDAIESLFCKLFNG